MKVVCKKCNWESEGNNEEELWMELYKHNVEKHNMPKNVKIQIKGRI